MADFLINEGYVDENYTEEALRKAIKRSLMKTREYMVILRQYLGYSMYESMSSDGFYHPAIEAAKEIAKERGYHRTELEDIKLECLDIIIKSSNK